MSHPSSRSERYVREVWRNHRRKTILTIYTPPDHDPTLNGGWLKGGKQYFACGNLCMYAMVERHRRHRETKVLRAEKFPLEE
jgi:hypothetical protein